MLPGSEVDFLRGKTGYLSHSGHKTAVTIDDTGETNNVLFLSFLLL